MKANILFITPSPSDATSWYRAWGPFGALRKENPGINLVTGVNKFTWPVFQMTDIAFMQRPYSNSHVKIAKMAKENKNKLWVDYDDDLFSVPGDNPAFGIYNSEETQKNIATIIAMADVVTVSTMFLKRRLERLNENIVVVNNGINDFILDDFDPKPFSDRPKFFNWRGSNTHQRDILSNSEAILNLEKKSWEKKWKWHWIGYNPWFLTEHFKNEGHAITSDPLDVMEYHHFIKKLQPTCQIVPLADNKFNRSKSNIAWLEATWSGAITIAPNWEEWRKPGVLTYSDVEGFGNQMELAMAMNDGELESMLKASRQEIAENYLLSKLNKIRENVISDLMGNCG